MSDVAYTIGAKSGNDEFDFVAWSNRYDGYDIVTSDSLEDYEGESFIRAEGETDVTVYRYDTEEEAREGLAEAKGTFDYLKLSILKMEEDDGEWWVDSIIEVDDDDSSDKEKSIEDESPVEEEIKTNEVDVSYDLQNWEEKLLEGFAMKYNMKQDAVMDIAVTFMLNEASAVIMKKPCMLSSVRPMDFLKLSPTTKLEMHTLVPTDVFVVGGEVRKASSVATICTNGEHSGEFMVNDESGHTWYESEFASDPVLKED